MLLRLASFLSSHQIYKCVTKTEKFARHLVERIYKVKKAPLPSKVLAMKSYVCLYARFVYNTFSRWKHFCTRASGYNNNRQPGTHRSFVISMFRLQSIDSAQLFRTIETIYHCAASPSMSFAAATAVSAEAKAKAAPEMASEEAANGYWKGCFCFCFTSNFRALFWFPSKLLLLLPMLRWIVDCRLETGFSSLEETSCNGGRKARVELSV